MFELIEIMNDKSPNILGDEVILIVSVTNEKLDLSSIKFAEYLYSKGQPILVSFGDRGRGGGGGVNGNSMKEDSSVTTSTPK